MWKLKENVVTEGPGRYGSEVYHGTSHVKCTTVLHTNMGPTAPQRHVGSYEFRSSTYISPTARRSTKEGLGSPEAPAGLLAK